MIETLRAVLRMYVAEEPEAFRIAEQFGIDALPALRPPRVEGCRSGTAQRAPG